MEPLVRFERTTYWLQVSCSTSWAKVAFGDPDGNRTHVSAVKGRCLNRLTKGPYINFAKDLSNFKSLVLVSHRGFEPRTTWLKVKCSTTWANDPSESHLLATAHIYYYIFFYLSIYFLKILLFFCNFLYFSKFILFI